MASNLVDDKSRQQIDERYAAEKQHGVKFFPDIVYKDMLVAFGVFLLLISLATFLGVKAEPPADPSDASYIPRPEWYFLFLFQMLKYFPGQLEWIGTTIVPAAAVLLLLLLPFIDRSPYRHWRKRKIAIGIMSVAVLGMVGLTLMAVAETPPQEEVGALTSISEQVVAGQDLYAVYCVECHGDEGQGGEIVGVEGLEGVVVAPLNAADFMYTRTDDTLYNILEYGQPDLGMPPLGLTYGGELPRADLLAIVAFMRYTWDDRVELPPDALAAFAIPTLAEGEIPSYSVHIEPLVRRSCISCHRPGKQNNNYWVRDLDEILTTGDHTPNVIAGDLGSNLIRMLHREEIEAGGPMPPTRELKPEWIAIWEAWVLAGMPEFPVTPAPDASPAASSSTSVPVPPPATPTP
jgi:menaquinol-cytochrome c reductase cytochrome b/c subunit